jgi:hypothetical protein
MRDPILHFIYTIYFNFVSINSYSFTYITYVEQFHINQFELYFLSIVNSITKRN